MALVKRANSRPYSERDLPRWKGVKFEWSFHRWTVADNPRKGIAKRQAELLEAKGWGPNHPIRRREYGGLWVADASHRVFYDYQPAVNDWDPLHPAPGNPLKLPGKVSPKNPYGLPEGHEWLYVLGSDLGFNEDPFALDIGAFSMTHPDLFHVDHWEGRQLTVTPIAQAIAEKTAKVGRFFGMVSDPGGGGNVTIETLQQEHGLPIVAAEKSEKRAYTDLCNDDLRHRRMWILKGSPLSREMQQLVYMEKLSKRRDSTVAVEDKRTPNDHCDAWRYLVRLARHHWSKSPLAGPKPGSAEWAEKQEAAAENREARAALRRARSGPGPGWDDWKNGEDW